MKKVYAICFCYSGCPGYEELSEEEKGIIEKFFCRNEYYAGIDGKLKSRINHPFRRKKDAIPFGIALIDFSRSDISPLMSNESDKRAFITAKVQRSLEKILGSYRKYEFRRRFFGMGLVDVAQEKEYMKSR